ncbi:MAG: UDP-N-acetylglucosamine--N-acetylmuramyl-(pentapeptide) pyrophosphoryl-undecaprenol N-acetylglucosamine transferase [Actinobacteria bacterium]|nr:UDP-N-acetylglucosamine--N-acetylmuramyl-(pentapeptide) pyrophosphoryl-undecaprenol N-acetylglucosamine transferase [Actinomycetota bacterium]
MKVVIIGGHLSPAFSVIEELLDTEILFIGRKYALEGDEAFSLEYQFCQEYNIPFKEISTGRIQRKLTKHTLSSVLKIPGGFLQALKILKDFKPDVVVGFGSYVQIPILTAAYMLKIPIVIHEQTLEAGLSNRISAKIAKKICISWESSRDYFPKGKTILTGNPVRKEIIKIREILKESKKKPFPVVFVTGGSLGSHKINCLIEKSIGKLVEFCRVIHQTGDAREFNDYELLEGGKKSLSLAHKDRYLLHKFLNSEEIAVILKEADLVVSRSGINTVTELIYLGKPAFLMPLPFAQRNEQYKNAEFLKELGLAEIGLEKLDSDDFTDSIRLMLKNLTKYSGKSNLKDIELIKNSSKNLAKIIWESAKK